MRTEFDVGDIWLEHYDAIYIEVPKVACSSIKTVIARILNIGLETTGGDPHEVTYPSPSQPLNNDGMFYPGIFTFGFVRNPWDRLVSCYRDKIRREVDGFTNFTIRPGVADCLARFDEFFAGMPFDKFVDAVTWIADKDADPHFRSQHTFLTNAQDKIAVDFVGRYESLAGDFRFVTRRVGIPSVELPHIQKALPTVNYADYYTAETRDLVARRFRKDIDLFGYEFESP
jgi:hypothetical protein